jgi:3,4-dihydroxy 2-butanone 4-phosphate synthase/GTP cyclohydrolase II
VKGDISGPEPVLVRMHATNLFGDMLGSTRGPGDVLNTAMRTIGEAGRGVVVLLRPRNMPALADLLEGRGRDPSEETRLKEYGIGAQILLDLGVKSMVLLTNTPERRAVALEGYGLQIVGTKPVGKGHPQ